MYMRDYSFFSNQHNTFSHVDIGNILYSNHALITAVWQWQVKNKNPFRWCLNNMLLENLKVAKVIEEEIKGYFQTNEGSANEIRVWECFISYMQCILISLMA